jgi:hypothetical protein
LKRLSSIRLDYNLNACQQKRSSLFKTFSVSVQPPQDKTEEPPVEMFLKVNVIY